MILVTALCLSQSVMAVSAARAPLGSSAGLALAFAAAHLVDNARSQFSVPDGSLCSLHDGGNCVSYHYESSRHSSHSAEDCAISVLHAGTVSYTGTFATEWLSVNSLVGHSDVDFLTIGAKQYGGSSLYHTGPYKVAVAPGTDITWHSRARDSSYVPATSLQGGPSA